MTTRTGLSVAVDARVLELSGLGRYLREILAALLADARFGRVELLGDPRSLRQFVAEHSPAGEVQINALPTGLYSPRAQLAWVARQARQTAADVTFFPHYDGPAWAMPPRSVVTVHDLIHFRVPDAFPVWRRAGAGLLLHRVVRQAAGIIAVSEATRRDLLERLPSVAGRVDVVPNGVSRAFLPDGEIRPADSARAMALQPFLLCVGNRKLHKNLTAAVDALAELRLERPDLRLVVAGRIYPGWEQVLQRAAALGVADALVDAGEPGDGILRALYAQCEVLLFPSMYEGFGLPVLEAMGCGAPVVASNRGATPEVVGNAGLLVDPAEPGAFAGAVRRLAREPALRAELIRRGRNHVRRFTWERSAARTLDILHAVAAGSRTEVSVLPRARKAPALVGRR